MRTYDFRILITNELKKKCPRVFFRRAPKDAVYPYVVYDLPSDGYVGAGDDYGLEIDLWDDKQDTMDLENLADSIEGDGDFLNPTGLNQSTVYYNGCYATFYKENRYPVPDEEESINRIQLRYRAKVYYE